jgi:hypothetical protein
MHSVYKYEGLNADKIESWTDIGMIIGSVPHLLESRAIATLEKIGLFGHSKEAAKSYSGNTEPDKHDKKSFPYAGPDLDFGSYDSSRKISNS